MKFTEIKCPFLQNKSTSTPTSPGPRTHSTPSIPVLTAGQSGLYSPQYISYIPQIHMGPAVQVGERLGEPRKMLKVQLNVDEQPVEPQFLPILRHLRCIHILFPIRCLGSRASTGVQKVSRLVGKDGWGCLVSRH